MMLVDAHAVEAELVRLLELVEILVVELGAPHGVVVAVGEGDPRVAVALDRVHVDGGIRHQMEVEDLHAALLCRAVKRRMASTISSGFSWATQCPQSRMMVASEPGIPAWKAA